MKNICLFFTICLFTTSIQAQWIQKGTDIDGESNNDQSGQSVCMNSDGNIVAIGATYNDGSASDAGHVRIYQWNGSAWVQKGADIDGEAADDQSGQSVSINSNGNTVAIGAPNNDGTGTDAGHVRIYQWIGSAWVQKGIDIDGEAAYDLSGYSVSMSSNGNTIAIGALNNDGSASNAGHVRVYQWIGSTWVQKGADIDGEAWVYDNSGCSVSMSPDGNTVAIGAVGNDGSASNAGHVRIYEWNVSAWVQKGADIDGEAAGDRSGNSVSISSDGNTVAIGARYAGPSSDAGHVRIYQWSGSSWVQKGADIDGTAYDYSGWSVSISSDGNMVAIGAKSYDGTGTDAGHVRIYQWIGSAWVQKGIDIDGEAAYDRSGYSVSMSSDGNTLAIGADGNDGTGTQWQAGHARIYNFCTATTSTDTQTACNSFVWINGNTYTSSNSSATHTLTNTAGCDSVVTLDLTINTVDNGITNSSPTLTANATAATYQWLDCDNNYAPISGETNQNYTATSSGSYAVEVTQNNCTDTSDCESVTVVGLLETKKSELLLYPNPTSGILTIKGAEGIATVYDIYGRMVLSANTNTLYISNAAMGIYFVRVVDVQGKVYVGKVVKE